MDPTPTIDRNTKSLMTLKAEAILRRPDEVPPRMSTWTNPTKDTIRLSLHVTRTVRRPDGPLDPELEGATPGIRPTVHVAERQVNVPQPIEIAPGATVEIPSMYDSAIKSVLCAEKECRDRGGYCTKDHPGTASAGLAPQLVKTGSPGRTHPVLLEQAASVTPITSTPRRTVR